MIKRLYPGGKKKAFNITYDDGVLQDIPFVALLDKYGIKEVCAYKQRKEFTIPISLAGGKFR